MSFRGLMQTGSRFFLPGLIVRRRQVGRAEQPIELRYQSKELVSVLFERNLCAKVVDSLVLRLVHCERSITGFSVFGMFAVEHP